MKLGHDGISHAAIDMLCTLMEPMHEDYDLKQVYFLKNPFMVTVTYISEYLFTGATEQIKSIKL